MFKQINYPRDLPVAAAREEIVAAIRENQVVILAGDTGSGKSTQLPKMCLEAGRGAEKMIGCTQPRRLAATSVSARVTEELGEEGRELVGCKIRFADRTGSATRIKFMTDGILLAEARRDRELLAYDTIIIDEAHERSLNIDFLLGILRRLVDRRPDLKIIVTSATIDTAKFAAAFSGAPVIQVAGRTFPVETIYLPPEKDDEEGGHVGQAVEAVLDLHKRDLSGDILVFMPTENDVRESVDLLRKALAHDPGVKREAVVLPLFGRLSGKDQNRIFHPVRGRKIVVATNVAETSITVPGIRYVVDSGLARISIYNARARTRKLPVRPISRASSDQRRGRCGRTGPGICVRLYSEEDYLNRDEFTRPEIQRSDLAEVVLRMLSLHLGDPGTFPFIDPPSPQAIRDGFSLLFELGAIRMKGGDRRTAQLTARGKMMARLPLDPRISRMILEAKERNCLREISIIASALSIPDPRVRPAEHEKEADAAHEKFSKSGSDFLSFLAIWDECGRLPSLGRLSRFCRQNYLSYQRLREWRDIHGQIVSILQREKGFPLNSGEAPLDAVHQAIMSGSLRNIGFIKSKNIYQGGHDSEVMIFPGSSLFNKGGKWIMAAEFVETSRLFARCVANIRPEWIEPMARHLCRYSWSEPHWEKKRGQVVAFENVTLFGLIIEARRKVNYGAVKPEESRQIFIQEALVAGELGGDFPFLSHNKGLAEKLIEMEDRVRERDIMADDWTLFSFYEERIPAEVWDRNTLKRLLKKVGDDAFLMMREEDILKNEPGDEKLAAFPDEIEMGGFSLKLSYRFEPGAEDDGISVHVPVELVEHIEPGQMEWLVPGMLEEKLVFLLKALPKSLRRPLVPVPDTAGKLVAALPFGRGHFFGVLRDHIRALYQIDIERHNWQVDALPDHLRPRYCLQDTTGRVIRASRDFADIATAPSAKVIGESSETVEKIRGRYEREGVCEWDFEGLPERIAVKDNHGRLQGFLWPALEENSQGGVNVRLCSSRTESRALTRRGLLALYRPLFNNFKGVKKEFAVSQENWALFEGLPGRVEFNESLRWFILEEVFSTREGRIPGRDEFEERAAAVRGEGIFRLGRRLLDQVVALLKERRAVLDLIVRFHGITVKGRKEVSADFHDHLAKAVPDNFLDIFDGARMKAAIRSLKALQIRIEREHADPARDRVRSGKVKIHDERLAVAISRQVFSPEYDRQLEEFRQMVDEYRISVFAQELKTAFPVSEKRLEEKWRELNGLL
ncbi:MAG: ATP-dependent RNA helicase HrpA [Proteobacteria bacterium]|nr:ATP-dependent RNA helicase HrpA [Pseudomonadota bacterium]MBU1738446.1 ATP-dependent RNA helicase HrpA [Pseudomonadota bacterium]